MSQRPRIDPGLLARMTEAAPGRLVRKLDRDPAMAEAWRWDRGPADAVVTTSGGERVTLRPSSDVLAAPGEIECSCLLTPRCLHVLAVLTRLELTDAPGAAGDEATTSPPADAPGPPAGAVELTGVQARAADTLWRAAADLLEAGASAAGAALQAELLRAVHDCRSIGLHRIGSAGLRMVRGVRDLREERPEFSLARYHADLVEALEVSAHLGAISAAAAPRAVAAHWRGAARRSYNAVGSLRLFGLFTEPVIAGSGYAGVSTYLCDGRGAVYTVVDVVPTDMQRSRATYDRVTRIAEAGLTHRELCREGLFMQGATGSADGRLGAGARVKAARAGAASWTDEGAARLWSASLTDQIARAYRHVDLPLLDRPAGCDLLFIKAAVAGTDGQALVVISDEGVPLRCVPPSDHERLYTQHNLELLARTPGLPLMIVGRLRPERPRTIALLAAGPADDSGDARFELPAAWGGRCNLGLDRLQATHIRGILPSSAAAPFTAAPEPDDPLGALRRRIHRLAIGGRATLPPEAGAAIDREALRLERRLMPGAAALLRGLRDVSLDPGRDTSGARRKTDPDPLARAFLAAALYERAANLSLQRSCWLS